MYFRFKLKILLESELRCLKYINHCIKGKLSDVANQLPPTRLIDSQYNGGKSHYNDVEKHHPR